MSGHLKLLMEKMMSEDTLELSGMVQNFPAKLTLALAPEAFDTNGDYMSGLIASLEALGFTPPVAPVAAPRAIGGGTSPAPSANGAGCPTHGLTKARTGFRGVGFDCGAWSDKKEPWSKEGKLMQDGRTVYYCASKWS